LAAQVADKRAEADKIERKLLVDRSVLESQIAQKIERHHQIQHKKRAKKRENAITRKTRENARAGPPSYGTGLHSLSHRCNNEIIGSTLPVW
jgi:hypothetical protein